jgi:hypothetical protein
VDVDCLAVELPGREAGETVAVDGAEEGLAACSQVVEVLPERRDRIGADQVRLDPVRTALDLEHLDRDVRVCDVQR